MARLHYVKAAAKDYPSAGIKKGESYYWWKPYRQGKRMSKERPKPSQVTSSEYESQVLSLVEELEGWQGDWTEAERDDLIGRLEEIRDEQQDKFDNMPEGLQYGSVGILLEERVQALDEWIDELGNIEFEEGEEEAEEDSPLEKALAASPSL